MVGAVCVFEQAVALTSKTRGMAVFRALAVKVFICVLFLWVSISGLTNIPRSCILGVC